MNLVEPALMPVVADEEAEEEGEDTEAVVPDPPPPEAMELRDATGSRNYGTISHAQPYGLPYDTDLRTLKLYFRCLICIPLADVPILDLTAVQHVPRHLSEIT